MTAYVFHYDFESEKCVEAAPVLLALHRKYQVSATFFMLGRIVEAHAQRLKELFGDDPLFDLGSHTYSHRLLKDSRMHGPGVDLETMRSEIERGIRIVEDVFERPCLGVRTGYGFFNGFRGDVERLQIVASCGVRYLSSDLRGPGDSIPAGLVQAYWYDEEGFADLLELPGHGWHDNVLNGFFNQGPCLPWPPALPWGVPDRVPRTPEEEFEVQMTWLRRASDLGLDYFSPVYHPHSIYRKSPACETIERLLCHVVDRGIPTTTYTALYHRYAANPTALPGRSAWTWDDERAS